ncbi:MAG TPA: hypothetical protein VFI41_04875 [Gemmatimonadales bacterium]|nr:hypothetical protein [Gemmatimonadales bacterium]
MAVNSERSMNKDMRQGAVDHTIRLRQGEDRGGPLDQANYYNHLVGSQAFLETGDFLVDDYLRGIVR